VFLVFVQLFIFTDREVAYMDHVIKEVKMYRKKHRYEDAAILTEVTGSH
jgi:hypothetical protein